MSSEPHDRLNLVQLVLIFLMGVFALAAIGLFSPAVVR